MTSPTSADAEIRMALATVLTPRSDALPVGEMGVGSEDLEPGRHYLAGTVEGGWALPEWPERYGGRDATPDEAARIYRIREEFAVPDLYAYLIGLGIAGPTILEHGTPNQQERWLRPIADGSEIWCQLFSEPEAGSDLANLAMRAARLGDEWRLNGQKLWVSRSMWARWGLLLARSDPSVPKHRGLTMFALDMESMGINIRPLEQINGDRHFAEVFLDEVAVPDTWRIGEVGAGWTVALTALGNERAVGGQQPSVEEHVIPSWLLNLAADGKLTDPAIRHRAVDAVGLDRLARLSAARTAADGGSAQGASGSARKLERVRVYKAEAALLKDSQGAHGMLVDHAGHSKFLTAPSMSIRGGTDEIQRNIVGERILGLPAEPRLDREEPWKVVRRGLL